jgi:alpha-tubulin suppressor-like RCC1 family protein
MTRRTLLALLSSAPVAARAAMQTPTPLPRRLVCDGSRAFLRETDGTVLAWRHGGLGYRGVAFGLGQRDDVPQYIAFPVPGLRNVADVAMGGNGGYALMADGGVLAWGVNSRGGVGNTPLAAFQSMADFPPEVSAPTPVLGITDAVSISAHGNHTLALTRGGTVFAWGDNAQYQLGIGEWPVITYKTRSAQPTNFMPYPVPIPGLSGVAAIAAGDEHSIALMKDGTVRAWGLNRWGQLGDGTVITRKTPVLVAGIKNAVAVAAAVRVSAAVLADGTVMTWGFGTSGLGRTMKQDAPHPMPGPVAGVAGIRALAFSGGHTLALTNAGTVVSWGDDTHGKLGHRKPGAARVEGLNDIQSIAVGGAGSFAIDAKGRIMTWGQVPFWARVDTDHADVSRWPIPLVIKGLKNL